MTVKALKTAQTRDSASVESQLRAAVARAVAARLAALRGTDKPRRSA